MRTLAKLTLALVAALTVLAPVSASAAAPAHTSASAPLGDGPVGEVLDDVLNDGILDD